MQVRRRVHDARQTRLELTPEPTHCSDGHWTACEAALRYLAASAEVDGGLELLAALDRWVPSLDTAAVELRQRLDRIEKPKAG